MHKKCLVQLLTSVTYYHHQHLRILLQDMYT